MTSVELLLYEPSAIDVELDTVNQKITNQQVIFKSQQKRALNAELNPICHLLALLGAHHILHVSRIRVTVCWK